MFRSMKTPASALLCTTAFFALATPAGAQTLNVPAGTTYTLTADETYDALTGSGTVVLGNNGLTIGTNGSSSLFSGTINDDTLQFVGSWAVSDGPYWGPLNVPVSTAVQTAANLFGGNAADYRISTNGTDPTLINDSAHYDQIYVGPGIFADDYYFDNGDGLYNNPYDASPYVSDNTSGAINYAFAGGAGVGDLTKIGIGTLTLTGTNNWHGVTTVSGGTLAGTTLSISGASITNNATLAYNQNFSGTVSQDITGSGTINVSGLTNGSTLTFAGDITQNSMVLLDGSSIQLQGTNTLTGAIGIYAPGGSRLTIASGATVSAPTAAIYGAGGLLTIDNSGLITGPNWSIYADGTLTLTNNLGATVGNGGTAIELSNTGINAIINAGLISGGVILTEGGTLNLTNQTSGNIVDTSSEAVFAVAGSTLNVNNSGDIVGKWSGVRTVGAGTVTNSGRIAAGTMSGETITFDGLYNGVELGSGTVTNLAGGQITGTTNGVAIFGANALVTNAGSIVGTGGTNQAAIQLFGADGRVNNQGGGTINGSNVGVLYRGANSILDNAGSVSGGTGVQLMNSGTINNALGGTISGTSLAILASGTGPVTLTNFGDITGGVNSTGGATLIVDNKATGNIVRVTFGSAIDMSNGGRLTLTNAGDIVGSGWGVVGRNSGDSIVNSGRIASGTISGETITPGGSQAVYLISGGSLTNTATGSILSGNVAVQMDAVGTVVNSGLINGTNNGILMTTGTVTNNAGATVASNGRAIRFTGTGTVTNAGTVSGNTQGILIQGANSRVDNLLGGLVSGVRGVEFDGANALLNNSGTINGTTTSGYAVMLFNGGTVNNNAGATINGGYRGVYIQGAAGNVINAGTIIGGLDNAISLFNGGTVNNQAGGTLTALGTGGWGIYGTGGALSLTNAGTINADTGIVTNANDAMVFNSGSITGTVNGIYGYNGTSLSLTNSGSIVATNDSAVLATGALTLANQAGGTIRSNASGVFDGVTVANGAAATVTNAGTISAKTGSGVAFSGASTLTNTGSISGGTDAGAGFAVRFANGSSGTLTNLSGGVLNAGVAGAVLAATDGAVTLDMQSGSTVNGKIVSIGAGARTVTVGGTLGGMYDATAGTGIDSFTLAATGSMTSASLGAGNDSFTTLGGAISGAVDGGAGTDSLTFNVAGSVTYAGNFTGFETGTKTGAGLVNLTGANVVTAMAVNGGTLAVNGSLASNVTVNPGGKLGGTGTIIGSLTIGSGGILAPGNSIGTVNVTGNLTFASGSTYQVEISPSASDRTNATGNIVINGGTVSILGGAGVYAPLTTYTILSAGGSVTGTFASVTDNLAFLDPTLVYTSNQVLLQMRRNDIDFTDAAVTPNQVEVAGALQTLPIGTLYDAILTSSVSGAQQAYDALSGEIYASTPAVLAQQGDRLRVALLETDAADANGMSLWADAKAGHSNLGATKAGSAPVVTDHRDLLVGAKWQGNGFSAVVGGGISRAEVDVSRRDSSADVDSWMLGGQLGYRSGALRLAAGMTYAWHKIDTDRTILFPGYADAASSSQDGSTRTIYGEIAYNLRNHGIGVKPFLGLSNQRVRTDSLIEAGGSAALSVDPAGLDTTMTELGVRFSGSAKLGNGTLFPIGTVAWQHLIGDRQGTMEASFANSDPFDIKGAKRSRDGLRVNAGLGYRLGGASIGIAYDGRLADGDTDHGVRLTAGVSF